MDFLNKSNICSGIRDEEINSYTNNGKHPNFFTENQKLHIFEDDENEFKMMNISNKQDIPEKIHILDKYICAFLNTNSGVIYIGVTDEGKVNGIKVESKLLELFKKELENLITKHDKHVSDNKLVTFNFKPLYTNNYNKGNETLDEIKEKNHTYYNHNDYKNNNFNCNYNLKVKEDFYVLEIFVHKGAPYKVYFTTIKDQASEQLKCYVKLNGTLKHLEGKELYKYAKRKVKMFCLSMKNDESELGVNNGRNKKLELREKHFLKNRKYNKNGFSDDSMCVNDLDMYEGLNVKRNYVEFDSNFNLKNQHCNLTLKENINFLITTLRENFDPSLNIINQINLLKRETGDEFEGYKIDKSFFNEDNIVHSKFNLYDKYAEKKYPEIEDGEDIDVEFQF